MAAQSELYRDIATRTGGDIYIGVVGPVRTGKSTLIKRFMETMVLPRIESEPAAAGPPMSCRNQQPGAPL